MARITARWAVRAAAGLGLVGLGAIPGVIAGPLNPPAGPVASSYKTLAEVEPRTAVQTLPGSAAALYVISQPGAYYLTANITGVSGKKGIAITASNVTLDLGGFSLIGGNVGDDAVYTGPGTTNVVVRDGVIKDWIKEGVDAFNTTQARVERVLVASSSNGYGVITGENGSIQGCQVLTSGAGIVTAPHCLVRACTAKGNAGAGFTLGPGTTAVDCTATGSTANPGGYGFDLADGCVLRSCSASANAYGGINTATACTVEGCSATGSAQASGIYAGDRCSILNNTCGGNRIGIYVVGAGNLVLGNNSSGNLGGTGIQVIGSNNRIDSNTVCNNGNGSGGIRVMDFSPTGCVIVRNSARGNGGLFGGEDNYEVDAGANDVGPIGRAATATSPWANLSN